MNRRNKIILGVLALLTLVGILTVVLTTNGSGNAYSGMRLRLDRDQVNITVQMSRNPDGTVIPTNTPGSQMWQSVTANVTGAPNSQTATLYISTENPHVATARVWHRSGNRSQIEIRAVGGGQTRVRIMTAGGGRVEYINVNVNVPSAMIIPAAEFGIMRSEDPMMPTTLQFAPQDFDFFVTPQGDQGFSNLNNIEYEVVSSLNTVTAMPISIPGIELDRVTGLMTVHSNSSVTSVFVRARLTHPTAPTHLSPIFEVHILPYVSTDNVRLRDMRTSIISEPNPQGNIVTSLVWNDTTQRTDFVSYIDYRIEVGNPGNLFAPGTQFGYFPINHNAVVAGNILESNDRIIINANGIGETYVDLVVYPILTRTGETIHFSDMVQHRDLHRTIRLRVESRNVFTRHASGGGDLLQTVHNDEPTSELFAFYSENREDRFQFNVNLADNLVVNNVGPINGPHRRNNHITFELVRGDVPVSGIGGIPNWVLASPQMLFDITFNEQPGFHSDTLMQSGHFDTGVPYGATFSISLARRIRDQLNEQQIQSLINAQNLQLRIRSIETSGEVIGTDGGGQPIFRPLTETLISINALRAVESMQLLEFRDSVFNEIDVLFPVRAATLNQGFFQFYMQTNLAGTQIDLNQFAVSFSDNAYIRRPTITPGEYELVPIFNVSNINMTTPSAGLGLTIPFGGDLVRFHIEINRTLTFAERAGIDLNLEYILEISYRNGYSIQTSISVLERLQSLDMQLRALSGVVYETTFNSSAMPVVNRIQNATVMVGGVYHLNLLPLPRTSSIAITVSAPPSISFNTDTFTLSPTTVGQNIPITITMHALNPDVLQPIRTALGTGTSAHFTINLNVINPLVGADLSDDLVTIYSSTSLGHYCGINGELCAEDGITPRGSFVDVDLDLSFASTTLANSAQVHTTDTLRIAIGHDRNQHISINDTVEFGDFMMVRRLTATRFRIYGFFATNGFTRLEFHIWQSFTGLSQPVMFTINAPRTIDIRVIDMEQVRHISSQDNIRAINVNLNNSPMTQIRVNPFPLRVIDHPHNHGIGWAFLPVSNNGRLVPNGSIFDDNGNPRTTLIDPRNGGQDVATINPRNGMLNALRSNIGSLETDTVLVAFAFDSIRRDEHGQLQNPLTYIRFNVFIFDETHGDGQYMIETLDQFLDVFGFDTGTVVNFGFGNRIFHARRPGFDNNLNIVLGGYYRLVADIDFTGRLLAPIPQFNGTLTGSMNYVLGSGEATTQFALQNITIEAGGMFVPGLGQTGGRNVHAREVWEIGTGNVTHEFYGLFAQIGSPSNLSARVEGVSFTNVNITSTRQRPNTEQHNRVHIGVLAGMNYGQVTDIIVTINYAFYNMNGFERLNFGAIVGTNRGIISEQNRLHVDGLVHVTHGADLNASTPASQTVHHLNLGGIVGLNDGGTSFQGKIIGLNTGNILNDNLHMNSEISLVFSATTIYVREDVDKNVGGIAGRNRGIIENVASQNVLYNTTRGNVGGLVGLNDRIDFGVWDNSLQTRYGHIINSYSTSAIYGHGIIGGLVGRNRGIIEQSFFDFYVNETIRRDMARVFSILPANIIIRDLDWINNPFYAGLMVGRGVNVQPAFINNISHQTTIGGVVGVNSGGHLHHAFATSIFTNETSFVFGDMRFRGDIFIFGAEGQRNVIVGGVIGRQENHAGSSESIIEGVFSNLSIHYERDPHDPNRRAQPVIGGIIGELASDARATITGAFSNNNYVINANSGEDTGGIGGRDPFTIGGHVGANRISTTHAANTQAPVTFVMTYSVLDNNNVHFLPTSATFTITRTRNLIGTGFRSSIVDDTAFAGNHYRDAVRFYGARPTGSLVGPTATAASPNLDLNINTWMISNPNVNGGWFFDRFNTNTLHARDFFINFSNVNYLASGQITHPHRGNEIAFINYMSGKAFPMLRQSFDPLERRYASVGVLQPQPFHIPYELSMFVAIPNAIDLNLRTQITHEASFNVNDRRTWGYDRIFGMPNNRGEFNFVVPATTNLLANDPLVRGICPIDIPNCTQSQKIRHINSAALFFSTGDFTVSNNIANRYYLDDIFDIAVSPLIASRRLHIELENNQGTAFLGRTMASGLPQYFIQITGLGEFQFMAMSTRHENEDEAIISRLHFDVVPAVTIHTVTHNSMGGIGTRSIHRRPELGFSDPHFRQIDFPVQRGRSFSLDASIDSAVWNIDARYGIRGITSDNRVLQNGFPMELFEMDPQGFSFRFTPYIQMSSQFVGNREYRLDALHLNFNVTVYSGAIYLDFRQDSATIDATSSTVYSGRFVTDEIANGLLYRVHPTLRTQVQTLSQDLQNVISLLSLAEFTFTEDGKVPQPLFGNPNQLGFTVNAEADRASVEIRLGPSAINHRNFDLIFILEIESRNDYVVTDRRGVPHAYQEFLFNIFMSVEVNLDEYLDIGATSPSVIPYGLTGQIGIHERSFRENQGTWSNFHRPLEVFAGVEILPQELHTVVIQHFTQLESVPGRPEFTLDLDQAASPNIFTEQGGEGGLLVIHAQPMFANINAFTLESEIVRENIGTDTDPLYKEWFIDFVQVVRERRADGDVFRVVPQQGDGAFRQVSSATWQNGRWVYSWDGVYYIRTILSENQREIPMQVPHGRRFPIHATFETINGRIITQTKELFAFDRPGLYFNYDGQITRRGIQAIGTSFDFSVEKIGQINIRQDGINAPNIFFGGERVTDGSITITQRNEFDYTLTIGSNIPEGREIRAVFTYDLFDTTGNIYRSRTSTLIIQTVLYRVTGLRIDSIAGNTVRVSSNTMQSMFLRVITQQYQGTSELGSRIREDIQRLEREINADPRFSEYLVWRGYGTTGQGWTLNHSPLIDGYYNNAVGPHAWGDMRDQLNFFLGQSGADSRTPGVKFIIASAAWNQPSSLNIQMHYEFVGGRYRILQRGGRNIQSTFNIVTVQVTDENNPGIITHAGHGPGGLRGMSPDGHYILMNDIILNDWTPLDFVAASLDGNNRQLVVRGFNTQARLTSGNNPTLQRPNRIGIFTTIPANAVVKNINIVLPFIVDGTSRIQVNLTGGGFPNSTVANPISVGLLAGRNEGIITNVAVVMPSQFTHNEESGLNIADYENTSSFDGNRRSRFDIIVGDTNMNVVVGGLVGHNARVAGTNPAHGVISNSRVLVDVGVRSFTPGNNVQRAWVGGFAGLNDGYIVSSFSRDNYLENLAVSGGASGYIRTGGLVAVNNAQGVIRGSYVQGGLLNTGGFATRGGIRSLSTSAGFAHTNYGVIEDAYVNVRFHDGPAARVGFVASQVGANAIIRNAFVQNIFDHIVVNFGADHPFIHTGTGYSRAGNFENNKIAQVPGVNLPNQPLWFDPIANVTEIENFTGFSVSQPHETQMPNIWHMHNAIGPRLVGANHIATSIRIQDGFLPDGRTPNIRPAPGFENSRNNPTVIWNGAQFNRYIVENSGAFLRETEGGDNWTWDDFVFPDYIRLVNNISMQGTAFRTFETIFSGHFDGNGLEIHDISINAPDFADLAGNIADNSGNVLQSIGLFSRLEYATVKNINLNFVRITPTHNYSIYAIHTPFVGGLAGISVNSNVVDVNIINRDNSPFVRLSGHNVIGGAIGVAVNFEHDGNIGQTSKIENVFSNVAVRSTLRNTPGAVIDISFQSADDYFHLPLTQQSIAGGVIGVTAYDLSSSDYSHLFMRDINGSEITENIRPIIREIEIINPDTPAEIEIIHLESTIRNIGNYVPPSRAIIAGATFSLSVDAEIAGGLVGVIAENVVIDGATLEFSSANNTASTHNHIIGKFYVGGIAGINMGHLYNSELVKPAFNVQSSDGANFVFRGIDGSGSRPHVPGNQNRIHFGMIVGGIAGFNSGIIDNAQNRTPMNNVNFANVMATGGIAGENSGGIIRNSGVHSEVRSGFYLGGLVAFNRGGGIIENTTIATAVFGPITGNVENTILWGQVIDNTRFVNPIFGTPHGAQENQLNELATEFNLYRHGNLRRTFVGAIIGFTIGIAPTII